MKIIDRLSQFIEYKGISLNSFDKSIGASNGYIGKQIKNKASIGVDLVEKISSIYPDLSLQWLIKGEGKMIENVQSEKRNELNLYENSVLIEKEAIISLLTNQLEIKDKQIQDLLQIMKNK